MFNGDGVLADQLDCRPFGEPVPVQGAVAGVRKSFIDKERDMESGAMNLGVRQMERARFLSIDPLWEKYQGLSPYVYANNSPLTLVDRDGFEVTFYKVDEKGNYLKDKEGNYIRDSFMERCYFRVLAELKRTGATGAAMKLQYLVDTKGFTINVVRGDGDWSDNGFSYNPDKPNMVTTLRWNPQAALSYDAYDEEGGYIIEEYLSPALSLVHEGDHAYRYYTNRDQFLKDYDTDDPDYVRVTERQAIQAEFNAGEKLNRLRAMRPKYRGYNDMYNVTPEPNDTDPLQFLFKRLPKGGK